MIIFIQDDRIFINDVEYQTMADFAAENGLNSINVVSNWVRRDKIKSLVIPQFNGIRLVQTTKQKEMADFGEPEWSKNVKFD